jgi:hypothetical protein
MNASERAFYNQLRIRGVDKFCGRPQCIHLRDELIDQIFFLGYN